MLRVERIISFVLILGLAAVAVVNWRRAALFQVDNEQLRAKVAELESDVLSSSKHATAQATELELLKQRSAELVKLRGEVTQLRASNHVVQTLTAENQRLRTEIQQRRNTPASVAAQVGAPQPPASNTIFPKENWQFAGYGTPENALVSAIWAMREGNSQTYLNSLSPAEQQRTAANWQNMSAEQVAAKHQSDVANITGLRVLEQRIVGQGDVVMSVFIDGPGRTERVRLNQVNGEWKFSGFLREGQGGQPQQ
jgi:hypothetical protein